MPRLPLLVGRSFLAEWLSLGLFLLALGGFVGWHLYDDHQKIDEQERARLAGLTQTVERNLTPQIFGLNRALESIIGDLPAWHRQRDGAEANRRLQDIADTLPGTRTIVVIDAQGVARFSNNVEVRGKNLSKHPYFQTVLKAPSKTTLYLAPPFTSVINTYLIGFIRMIPGPNGEFAGLVLAAIDPTYFEVLLDSVRYAPDARTTLVHGDGILYMMVPSPPGMAGKDLAKPGTLFSQHRASGQVVSEFADIVATTGTRRLGAMRSIQPALLAMDKPLVMAISRDYAAVFSDWRRMANHQIGVFGALLLFSVTALYLSQRRRRLYFVERESASERIKGLLAEQRLIFDHAHVGIIFVRERKIVRGNQHLADMFGYASPAELEGRSTELFYLSPEQYQAVGAEIYPPLVQQGFAQVEVVLKKRDGEHIGILLSGRPVNPDAVGEGSIWVCSDITERKRAETEMRIAATAFASQEAMMVTDAHGVILRVNEAFTTSTGYSAADVVGKKPSILRSGRHDAAFYGEMWETLLGTGRWQGEIWDRRKDGAVHPGWLTISAVKNDQGAVTHFVSAHVDITQRKAAEDQIRQLAFFDPLTGLPNRRLLLDRHKQAAAFSARGERVGALLFIDIDHFKTLNDTLGHFKGDLLLQQAAQRLIACVREGDTVARLGGDEFMVMLENLSEDDREAAARSEAIGEKMLAALGQAYQLEGTEFRSSASIGVTLFKGHQTSIDDLFKQADLAMYKAKSAGRNALRFFDPLMESAVVERVALESELRRAIGGEQLVLHYQVQVDREGRPVGAEALVRWNHPERGIVPPLDFIPLAEETGLIVPLGRWVLAAACGQLVAWAQRPATAHLTLAVNVSSREFHQKDFVDQVLSALDRCGADPQRLKLELTESLLAENIEDIVRKMTLLKARGVRFSLDDFGTGYSSLTYLKRLPLNQLKIDQSFVRDVLVDANDAAIARTVIALAETFGLDVIAEGVETIVQREFLASEGCHAYQGYLYGRPLPVADFDQACGSPTTSR